jgi:hypothetical protein
MRPAGSIEDRVRNIQIEIDPLRDQALLDELLESQSQFGRRRVGPKQRREKIMIWTRRITKTGVAAGAIILGIIAVSRFTGSANGASTAWGSVVTSYAKVDKVHFIKLNVGKEGIRAVYEGWHADGKTVYRDHDGAMSYDDGKVQRSFDRNGTLIEEHPSPATIGMGLFEHLSRGLFSPGNEELNRQKPRKVGDDFLIYEFTPPERDRDWLESVSVTAGKNSLLPIQVKINNRRGNALMIIFDYEAPSPPSEFFEPPRTAKAPHGKGEVVLDGEATRIELTGVPGVQAAMVRLHDKYDGPAKGVPISIRQTYKRRGGPIYRLDVTFVADDGSKSPTNDLFRLWPDLGDNGGMVWKNWPGGGERYIRHVPVIRPRDREGVFVVEISCWLEPWPKPR